MSEDRVKKKILMELAEEKTVSLHYRPDWEQVRERHAAWWKRELTRSSLGLHLLSQKDRRGCPRASCTGESQGQVPGC